MSPQPYAAFAIVVRDGLVLAVSRKTDFADMNLPGGKCDPNESGEACVLRELFEETGLVATEATFVCHRPERHHERVEVYRVNDPGGDPVMREAGRVAWVKPEELVTGTYGAFNRRALKDAGLLDD